MRRANSLRHACAWLIAAVVVNSSVALAGDVTKERKKAMTPEALSRCEARLKQLKPGQPIDEKTFGFAFLAVKDGGRTSYAAVADGWVSSMSGDLPGAFGLGQCCGHDSSSVWGQHVFGYVWGGMTLVPKYRVLTRARLISKDEYARREKEKSVGKLEGKSGTIYFDGPVFVENHEIAGTDPAEAAKQEGSKPKKGGPQDIANLTEQMCSEAYYQEAQGVLDGLAAGTLLWDVPSRLGGVLLTIDFGQSYSLQMKGFLNTTGMAPWTASKPDGLYEVWTFGTMVNGQDTPQRSLVFRNGSVVEVRPFTPKEELIGTLHP